MSRSIPCFARGHRTGWPWVLDFSGLEAGSVTYPVTEVPVAEAVFEAQSVIAPQLSTKGLAYTWTGVTPALTVLADREKLQQMLLNLFSNAVKFTHSRDGVPGRIEVGCAGRYGAWCARSYLRHGYR